MNINLTRAPEAFLSLPLQMTPKTLDATLSITQVELKPPLRRAHAMFCE